MSLIIRQPPPTVTLEAREVADCIITAQAWLACKQHHKVHNQKVNKHQTEFETIYYGCMGQLLVSRALQLPSWDRSTHPEGDGGIDLDYYGTTVDVKTNTYAGPPEELFFYVDSMEKFKAHALIGVQVLSFVRARIWGVISREKFAASWGTENFGHGNRCAVPAMQLDSLDVLIQRAARYEGAFPGALGSG